jgi:hypothetical protein
VIRDDAGHLVRTEGRAPAASPTLRRLIIKRAVDEEFDAWLGRGASPYSGPEQWTGGER